MSKNRFKVFQLPFWAKTTFDDFEYSKEKFLECVGEEIAPVFNRHGVYIDRIAKKCWIECEFGCYDATKSQYGQVLYELSLLDHRPLTDTERKALSDLSSYNSKVLTKKVLNIWRKDNEWREVRSVYRESRKFSIGFKNNNWKTK